MLEALLGFGGGGNGKARSQSWRVQRMEGYIICWTGTVYS